MKNNQKLLPFINTYNIVMNIDLHGVSVGPCETDKGDYTITFYHKDHSRDEVLEAIPNNYVINHKDRLEGGELLKWFVKKQ